MNSRRAAFLTLGLLASSLSLANDDEVITRKTHREQAGKLDASGWIAATSTEGTYSVRLPCAFDDFTEIKGAENCYVLECIYGDYKKFSAHKYKYQNLEKAKQKFRKLQDNYGFFADRVTKSTYKGNPSFEVSMSNSGECAYVQAIQAKSDVILLIASDNETPVCPNLEVMSRQFFDSLIIDVKPLTQ
jgi:hypothetical protein